MNEELFDISKFNIIQDEENYYFFRALNMADNSDIEQGIIASQNNQIERIRIDAKFSLILQIIKLKLEMDIWIEF